MQMERRIANMLAIFVSDLGPEQPPEEITLEELNRRNEAIEAHGLEDCGFWAPVEQAASDAN